VDVDIGGDVVRLVGGVLPPWTRVELHHHLGRLTVSCLNLMIPQP
jgi:hypothetical protein